MVDFFTKFDVDEGNTKLSLQLTDYGTSRI